MTKKEFLRQYLDLSREIDAKLEEVSRYRALATKVTQSLAPDKVQCTQGNNFDRVMATLIDLKNQACEDVVVKLRSQAKIIAAINRLQDQRYREVLQRRYIGGETWDEIAVHMHYDRRWVTKLHGEALERIALESPY